MPILAGHFFALPNLSSSSQESVSFSCFLIYNNNRWQPFTIYIALQTVHAQIVLAKIGNRHSGGPEIFFHNGHKTSFSTQQA